MNVDDTIHYFFDLNNQIILKYKTETNNLKWATCRDIICRSVKYEIRNSKIIIIKVSFNRSGLDYFNATNIYSVTTGW